MSSEKMILSGVSFDSNNDIKYSKPKVNAVGGKSVGILNAATNSATYISTPLMLTWGLNTYTDDKTGRSTYDMSLQFPTSEYANSDTTEFLENMKVASHISEYKRVSEIGGSRQYGSHVVETTKFGVVDGKLVILESHSNFIKFERIK